VQGENLCFTVQERVSRNVKLFKRVGERVYHYWLATTYDVEIITREGQSSLLEFKNNLMIVVCVRLTKADQGLRGALKRGRRLVVGGTKKTHSCFLVALDEDGEGWW